MPESNLFVLIGIGQSLRGDDAAGLEAVAFWQSRYPQFAANSRLRIELAEVPGLDLLDLLEGARAALLVDAVQSGAPAGTLHFLEESDLATFPENPASLHSLGVTETLRLGRLLQPEGMPGQILVLGIEAAQFELGGSLSHAVLAALPQAAHRIQAQVESWLKAPP